MCTLSHMHAHTHTHTHAHTYAYTHTHAHIHTHTRASYLHHTLLCCPIYVDVLAADRQLAEEIKFDLKRFEEEQLLANVQRTPAVLTPHAQMVSEQLESDCRIESFDICCPPHTELWAYNTKGRSVYVTYATYILKLCT